MVQARHASWWASNVDFVIRLGIIGDTQGRYSVDGLMAKVRVHFGSVDEVWHVGDWQEASVLDGLEAMGKPLFIVNGNAPDDPAYPMTVTHVREGLKVGMVHRPPRPNDAWVKGLDICIHGHTHVWRDEQVGRTRFINVASATGAWNTSTRTMGILTLARGKAELAKIKL